MNKAVRHTEAAEKYYAGQEEELEHEFRKFWRSNVEKVIGEESSSSDSGSRRSAKGKINDEYKEKQKSIIDFARKEMARIRIAEDEVVAAYEAEIQKHRGALARRRRARLAKKVAKRMNKERKRRKKELKKLTKDCGSFWSKMGRRYFKHLSSKQEKKEEKKEENKNNKKKSFVSRIFKSLGKKNGEKTSKPRKPSKKKESEDLLEEVLRRHQADREKRAMRTKPANKVREIDVIRAKFPEIPATLLEDAALPEEDSIPARADELSLVYDLEMSDLDEGELPTMEELEKVQQQMNSRKSNFKVRFEDDNIYESISETGSNNVTVEVEVHKEDTSNEGIIVSLSDDSPSFPGSTVNRSAPVAIDREARFKKYVEVQEGKHLLDSDTSEDSRQPMVPQTGKHEKKIRILTNFYYCFFIFYSSPIYPKNWKP